MSGELGGTARSRRSEVVALASQDGPEAVAALLRHLADDDRRTRGWALIALAERHPPPPSDDVVAALAPGADPAQAPGLAIQRLTAGTAPATVVALGLTTTVAAALRSAEVQTRRRSAWLLGAVGDADAVPALLEALDDQDERVRALAAQSLGSLRDARAVPALERLLRSGPGWRVRRRVRHALDRLAG